MIDLNKDFLENEVDEFGWFKEDLEALEALLSKVTYDQRVFLNTLKEVVDADTIMLKINIRNEEYYYYLKK